MTQQNQQILLKSRPENAPGAENFELVESPMPELGPGQVLRRTIWLSVDPYMRGRMSEAKSYAEPAKLGQPMVGATVSQVVESNSPRFAAGDFVLGYDGWQAYACGDAKALRALDPAVAPVSYALGVLGMPGLTAYVAMLDIGQPKSGETVVVSAAAGAVGSIAGQIAKIHGCRVIGTAGSAEKCTFVTEALGLDACINYKTDDLGVALDAACPAGIDVYFDNVGGAILEAVLRRINVHARIPLVGLISQYNNETNPPPGPNLRPVLTQRALLRGMIVSDHTHRTPDFLRDMSDWLRDGRIHYREDIVTGLENTVSAFLGLFAGENTGKRIVKVADPA
jgi:NADPH-dependent curcumin reductase CurA